MNRVNAADRCIKRELVACRMHDRASGTFLADNAGADRVESDVPFPFGELAAQATVNPLPLIASQL